MAASAETHQWLLAEQAFPEAERQAADTLRQFLGGIALQTQVERADVPNNTTLLAAVTEARLGDEAARRMVELNVWRDLSERFKVPLQKPVHLRFSDGQLEQEGRRLATINRNTLEHTVLIPEMQRRTTLELKNTLVFEALQARGALQSHDAFVFSTTSTNMSAQEKSDYGLDAKTESCSIQRLSVMGNDAVLETAFVAGKPTPGSARQDIRIIKQLAAEQGVRINTDDGTDMLQYIVLVPKQDVPNGVSDMVARYDELAGGTFYGEAKPPQDYQQFSAECYAQSDAFAGVVHQVTNQLLAEAHLYSSPLEVIMRLDELSERYGVKYAADNSDVNVMVFGARSAMHLADYRHFMEQGDTTSAQQSLVKAQETAVSSSCPLFKGASSESGSESENSKGAEESSGKKMMNCPFCKARVYDDPCAKRLECWDCRALVVNGKLKSTGDGGAKARAERRAAQETERLEHMARQVEAVFETSKNEPLATKQLQPAGV